MIQKGLIHYILSPLGGIMDKCSEKTRDLLFVLGGLGIVLLIFMHNASMARFRFIFFYMIDCVFFGVMILSTLRKEMKPVKFRWPLMACWLAVGALMLVSGFAQNSDYLSEALLFLVAYPIAFICFNNCDRVRIFKNLIVIAKIAVVVFALSSFAFAPILQASYPGIFNNTNGAAYFLAVCITCQLVELIYDERLGWKTVWNLLLLAVAFAMLYYTNSRTGVLAVVVTLIGGVGIFMLTHGRKENLKCVLLLAVTCAVACIAVVNMVYLFQLRSQINFPYYFNTSTGEFYSTMKSEEPKTDTDQPKEDKKDTENEIFDVSGFNDRMRNKGTTENKTMDQYSTGRISIWLAYAKDLNWTGHAHTPKVYIAQLYKDISTTHMTILEIAYQSGIPAGIFYFLLNIGTGFVAIWFAWKNQKERYAAMPLMVTLAFGVMSMLGSCSVSLWYLTTLYYYMVLFPILANRKTQEQALAES